MDKKPSLYDLFNDDSLWGNQTAGNLSHEDIVNKNWNKIDGARRAGKQLANNPEWSNKIKERYKDENYKIEWSKKQKEGANALKENNIWRTNHKTAVENRSKKTEWIENNKKAREKLLADPQWHEKAKIAGQLRSQDSNWREKQKEGAKIKSDNPLWHQKMKDLGKKHSNDPNWREKQKEGCKERSKNTTWLENVKKSAKRSKGKPFVTPDGIFETLKSAEPFYNKLRNFNNAQSWLRDKLKKSTPGFYYISWEEYDNLTK